MIEKQPQAKVTHCRHISLACFKHIKEALIKEKKHTSNALLQHEVVVEQYGGSVQCVEISGKTGMGLDKLEEAILLQADELDLRSDTSGMGEGVVLESRVDKQVCSGQMCGAVCACLCDRV